MDKKMLGQCQSLGGINLTELYDATSRMYIFVDDIQWYTLVYKIVWYHIFLHKLV